MSRLSLLAAIFVAAASIVPTATSAAPNKTGRLAIDGVDYYYEMHGKLDSRLRGNDAAVPLLLLHGGLGSIDMFEPDVTTLAAGREVIAVDLQGHGRTPLGDRPFRLESMGDDMATLVKRLGYDKVDVMG